MSSCDSFIPFLHNFIANKMEKYVNNPFLVRLLICDSYISFLHNLITNITFVVYQLPINILSTSQKEKKRNNYLNDYKDFFFEK